MYCVNKCDHFISSLSLTELFIYVFHVFFFLHGVFCCVFVLNAIFLLLFFCFDLVSTSNRLPFMREYCDCKSKVYNVLTSNLEKVLLKKTSLHSTPSAFACAQRSNQLNNLNNICFALFCFVLFWFNWYFKWRKHTNEFSLIKIRWNCFHLPKCDSIALHRMQMLLIRNQVNGLEPMFEPLWTFDRSRREPDLQHWHSHLTAQHSSHGWLIFQFYCLKLHIYCKFARVCNSLKLAWIQIISQELERECYL